MAASSTIRTTDLGAMIQFFLEEECGLINLGDAMVINQRGYDDYIFPHFIVNAEGYFHLNVEDEYIYHIEQFENFDRYKKGRLQDITHQWVLDFRDPASFVKLKNILLGTP